MDGQAERDQLVQLAQAYVAADAAVERSCCTQLVGNSCAAAAAAFDLIVDSVVQGPAPAAASTPAHTYGWPRGDGGAGDGRKGRGTDSA